METATDIARIFGPLFIIVGAWVFFNKKRFGDIVNSFKGTPALLFLMGILNTFFGLVVITFYNNWSWDWTILATLVGWVFFLRGICILYFSKQFVKVASKPTVAIVRGFVMVIWGAALFYYGYLI